MALNSDALCSVTQVRNALGDPNADEDVIFDSINAFSKAIQRYCRRMWMPVDANPRTLKFMYDGNGILDLGDSDTPVEIKAGTVTQIMLHSDLPAGTDAFAQLVLSPGDSLNEADYRLYPLNQTESGTYTYLALPLACARRVSGSLAPVSLDAKQVEVSITAKFGAGSVPDDVVKACIRECANDYRNPEGFQSRNLGELSFSEPTSDMAGGSGGGLPPLSRGTRQLLYGYRVPVLA